MKYLPLIAVLLMFVPGLASAQNLPDIVVAADNVDWLELDDALEVARKEGKKVLIDVYAPWCGFCRRMHVETYADEEVSKYMQEHFVSARVNGDSSDEVYHFGDRRFTGTELSYQLGARGFPTTVFLFSDGNYLTPLPGFVPPENFLTVLRYLATDAFEEESFEEFTARDGR